MRAPLVGGMNLPPLALLLGSGDDIGLSVSEGDSGILENAELWLEPLELEGWMVDIVGELLCPGAPGSRNKAAATSASAGE